MPISINASASQLLNDNFAHELKIKLDRSFVTDFSYFEEKRVLVKSIIDLARNLNMSVVAEGVETDQELQALKQLDCSNIQGFYYSKPVLWEEIENLYLSPKLIK